MADLSNCKYTTKFVATARVYSPTKNEKDEVLASLDQLKSLIPSDVNPESEPDLIFIVGNLAVGGTLNLNDDGVTIDDALNIYQKFERRQTNIEHNRKQIVGYILKAGLSEFGTDRLMTEEEVRSANKPFNIVTVAVIWRVANRDLCNFIEENAMTGVDQDALSLSFEVGFNDYNVVVLPEGTIDLSKATKIIPSDDKQFDQYDKILKVNDGNGKIGKNRVGRILSGTLIPLGQGIVTIPAAAVKGITPIFSNPSSWSNSIDAGNGHSHSSTHLTLQSDDAQPIIDFGNSIPDMYLYPSQESGDSYGPDYGRETNPHVTALFGMKDNDPSKIQDICADQEPITITLGKVSLFQNDDKPYDVLYIGIDSPQLNDLHNSIKSNVDNDQSYPSFTPHATVAYVKKGFGSRYVGDNQFEGKQITFSSLTFSPSIGDKTEIPFKSPTHSVYSLNIMSTTKGNRVKIPAGLLEKAKGLNYPKADITLSDGRTLKGITVFNGEELDLDKELSLEGVVITDMTPQVPPQIDDSPTIHPHIDEKFPTEILEKQAENAKQEEIKDILRNMPYTDAILKHLEAAARLLQIIASESSVSPNAAINTSLQSLSSTMKLEDLKQLEAKVKSASTKEEAIEAFASIALFSEEIMKASEKHAQAAKEAQCAKDEADKTVATMKTELTEAKKTLQDLKDAQAAAKAEASFQSHMNSVNAYFTLDDDVRGEIVSEIRACVDDASFDKWFVRAKKLMKGYVKAGTQDVNSLDTKDNGDHTVKHGDSQTVDSLEAAKVDPAKKDKEDEACMSANKAVIASAQANPTNVLDIDVLGNVGSAKTLAEQYRLAFASGVSVGGKTVKDFSEINKK